MPPAGPGRTGRRRREREGGGEMPPAGPDRTGRRQREKEIRALRALRVCPSGQDPPEAHTTPFRAQRACPSGQDPPEAHFPKRPKHVADWRHCRCLPRHQAKQVFF